MSRNSQQPAKPAEIPSLAVPTRPKSRNIRFNVAQKSRSKANNSTINANSVGFLPKMVPQKSSSDLSRNTPKLSRNPNETGPISNNGPATFEDISLVQFTHQPQITPGTLSHSQSAANMHVTHYRPHQTGIMSTNISTSSQSNVSQQYDSSSRGGNNHSNSTTVHNQNNNINNSNSSTGAVGYSPHQSQNYNHASHSNLNSSNSQLKQLLNQESMAREAKLLEEQFQYVIEPSQFSSKQNGCIKGYAANTHHGLFRNYNQDRVSIILSISQPNNKKIEYWPQCSFFAVYDGHGGAACADFLRDNLHLFLSFFSDCQTPSLIQIIKEDCFPINPQEAIKRGFANAESTFVSLADQNLDRSGSCAIIALILDDTVYIANVGDSRAVLSEKSGTTITDLSNDHKPQDEQKRIVAAGGHIYQANNGNLPLNFTFAGIKIVTPFRVFPGKLSVSRTFGDIEAKMPQYGGNPKVVIAEPEITVLQIKQQHDFIILACDGIFDRLNSDQALQSIWDELQINNAKDVHRNCAVGIEALIRESFEKRTLDNVTVVMLAFENFQKFSHPQSEESNQKIEDQAYNQQTERINEESGDLGSNQKLPSSEGQKNLKPTIQSFLSPNNSVGVIQTHNNQNDNSNIQSKPLNLPPSTQGSSTTGHATGQNHQTNPLQPSHNTNHNQVNGRNSGYGSFKPTFSNTGNMNGHGENQVISHTQQNPSSSNQNGNSHFSNTINHFNPGTGPGNSNSSNGVEGSENQIYFQEVSNSLTRNSGKKKTSNIAAQSIKPLFEDPLDTFQTEKFNNNNNNDHDYNQQVYSKFKNDEHINQNYYHKSEAGFPNTQNYQKSQLSADAHSVGGKSAKSLQIAESQTIYNNYSHSKSSSNLQKISSINNKNLTINNFNVNTNQSNNINSNMPSINLNPPMKQMVKSDTSANGFSQSYYKH